MSWFQVGPLHLELGILVDGLTAIMLVVVTAISLMVHIYSLGYMHGDERFTWFYVVLSMFTAAMLTVVVSNNLIQLLIGWEVMGVCSYLLIGHWWEEKENSNAADQGVHHHADRRRPVHVRHLRADRGHRVHHHNIQRRDRGDRRARRVGRSTCRWRPSCCSAARSGKSAQFPLHVWLPDAMAGPTPVSALIHAATMVAAGVYLIGRLFEVFVDASPWVLTTVSIIAAITMLGAALLAIVQDDIKRVLAYSTLSQLAYMVAGLSLGKPGLTAGFFHLFTHAFFKALLFLGAGSVIHAVHSNNMSDMGGLRKKMPITFWTMLIGSLALAGIFPFAGFWSKDELLVVAQETHHYWLFAAFLVTALITAFYTARMVMMTFSGEYRGTAHPHESPAVHDRAARRAGGRHDLRGPAGRAAVRGGVRQVGVLRRDRGRASSCRGSPCSARCWPWAGCSSATRCTRRTRERDPMEARAGTAVERLPEPLLHRRVLHAGHRATPRATRSRRGCTGSTRTCWTPS